MTLVVATATGETPDELLARARAAASAPGVGWVEVRLDGPSGLPWDLRPYFALARPALATVRAVEDGGRSAADDETRAEILVRALRAGARAVDVELASARARSLVAAAHEMGALAVVSLHDLSGTPPAEKIVATLREMRALGADVAKVATLARGPADAEALVRAALAARDEGIPAALMAVNDPFLRLLAPALGLALAYGAPPGQPPAMAGQVPADALRDAHARLADATAATRAAFLLGHPVAHSRSPAMQTAAFRAAGIDARYLALDVPPERLAAVVAALRAMRPLGANVTVPHKVAVLPLCDEVAPTARAAGAVNTLQVTDDGRLVGHNTDGDGALDALREAGVAPRRALVLGAGGAARAVASALTEAGVEAHVANRTPGRAVHVAAARQVPWDEVPAALERVDLLVNATTLGLHGEELPFGLPKRDLAVLDCVYGETPLVRKAAAMGLRVVRGESMLLHQGARSFRLWTGRAPPLSAMRLALEASA